MKSRAAAQFRTAVSGIEAALVDTETDSRRRRAAHGLAVVQLAGELAVEWGILPTEVEPAATVHHVYRVWCAGAGGQTINDALMAARRLKDFIDSNVNATILKVGTLGEREVWLAGEQQTSSRERAGWYHDRHIYLLSAAVEKVLGTYALKTFLGHAEKEGFFIRGDGRNLPSKVPGMGSLRALKFVPEALAAWISEENSDGVAIAEVGIEP